MPDTLSDGCKRVPLTVKFSMRIEKSNHTLLDVFRIEDRDLAYIQFDLCFRVQLDPIETAVLGIRVDAKDRAEVPACQFPELGTQMDLDPVTDLNGFFCHFFRLRNQKTTAPTTIIIPPLTAHCGSPVM